VSGRSVTVNNLDGDGLVAGETVGSAAPPTVTAREMEVAETGEPRRNARPSEWRIEPTAATAAGRGLPTVARSVKHLDLRFQRVVLVVIAPAPADVENGTKPSTDPSSHRHRLTKLHAFGEWG
jgi:hypothetical protein